MFSHPGSEAFRCMMRWNIWQPWSSQASMEFFCGAGHSLPGVSGQSFDVKCLSQMIYDQNPSPIHVKKLEDTLYPSTFLFRNSSPFCRGKKCFTNCSRVKCFWNIFQGYLFKNLGIEASNPGCFKFCTIIDFFKGTSSESLAA